MRALDAHAWLPWLYVGKFYCAVHGYYLPKKKRANLGQACWFVLFTARRFVRRHDS
jgi:hypothetical protein